MANKIWGGRNLLRPPRRGEQGKKRLAQGKASTSLRSGGPRLPLATMTPVSGFYTKRAECCEWNPGGVRFNHSSVPDFQVTLWPASYTSHQGPQRCGKKFKKQNKTRKPLNLCSFRKLVGGGKRMWAKRGVWWSDGGCRHPRRDQCPLPLGVFPYMG